MAKNARQVSLQEANAQYRKEDAARLHADVTNQARVKRAIETSSSKSAAKPRKSPSAGSRKKVQS